mgnify:CR=1 FL=1
MIHALTPAVVTTDESVWRVLPRVSPRVAIEAPRMFSSFSRVLRELFQNAYRAGATRVDVQWNSASQLWKFKMTAREWLTRKFCWMRVRAAGTKN